MASEVFKVTQFNTYERPCKVCSSFCSSLADSVRFHRQLAFKIVAIFRRMSNIYVVPYPALLGMEFVRTQELDEEISYLLTLPAAGNPSKLSLQISIFLHSADVPTNFKNMTFINTMFQKTKYILETNLNIRTFSRCQK